MKELIAFCGLDCERCEAFIATKNDDDALRKKVAKEWSELNDVDITSEMINCQGCRTDGVKTVYCDSLCPIRKCASSKKYDTCGSCSEMETCDKVAPIVSTNEVASYNLRAVSKGN